MKWNRKYRKSKARGIIYNIIEKNKEPISVDEIMIKTKENREHIGIATIYRVVDLLTDWGYLRYYTDNGIKRYRFNSGKHIITLICKKCGSIEHIDLDKIVSNNKFNEFTNNVNKLNGFKILHCDLKYYGYCNRCITKINLNEQEAKMIRIAFSSNGNNGLDSEISQHFGRCPYFIFINIENKEVIEVEAVKNPYEQSHGIGLVPEFISKNKADFIVSGGMGPRAVGFFESLDIKPVVGISGLIKDTVNDIIKGKYEVVRPDNYSMEKHDKHHEDMQNCDKDRDSKCK